MDDLNIPQQNFSGTVGGGELSLYQYFTFSPLFAEFKDFNGPERKLFLSDYSSMSPGVKNFFASVETATTLSSIGLSYQLDDNQVSAIAGTLRELFTGKVFIKDLAVTISSKLGIDDMKAGEIVNKIVSQSFEPILEDLKRVQRSRFPDKIMQLQKEARPEGLNKTSNEQRTTNNQTTTQQPLKPAPAAPKPEPQQAKPPLAQSLPPVVGVRPPPMPIQPKPAPKPAPQPAPQPIRPEFQAPSQPVKPSPSQPSPQNFAPPVPSMAPPPMRPLQSAPQQPQKPPAPEARLAPPGGRQFRIPDIGQPVTKENITNDPVQNLSADRHSEKGQVLNGASAQKSLEEALEKVAEVIDLRNKSEN